jgi:hypothetical protein
VDRHRNHGTGRSRRASGDQGDGGGLTIAKPAFRPMLNPQPNCDGILTATGKTSDNSHLPRDTPPMPMRPCVFAPKQLRAHPNEMD